LYLAPSSVAEMVKPLFIVLAGSLGVGWGVRGWAAALLLHCGGRGGRLDAIVQRISTRLPHRGVIVFNSVTPESCELFANAVTRHGLNVVDSQHVAINGFNPILIMKALKI